MWYPTNIVLKNLFSHSYTSFDFKRGESILLLGEILDEQEIEGADSNGAGKSTIIEAVCLAITAEVYRGVDKNSFIKDGEKSCNVELELQNDGVLNDVKALKIVRTFFKSSTSKLHIYYSHVDMEDGEFEEMTDIPTVSDGNKIILDMLGFTKDDFLNYFVIGQGNDKSFFSSGDAKQKEVIARFSNFNDIDIVLKQIDNSINRDRIIIAQHEVDLENVQKNETEYNNLLNEYKEQRKAKDKKEIEDLLNTIQKTTETTQILLDDIKTNNLSISKIKKEMDALKVEISKLPDLTEKRTVVIKSINGKELELRNLIVKLNQLAAQSGSIVKCPKCKNEFIPESEFSVKQVKAMILKTTKDKENMDIEMTSLNTQKQTIDDELENVGKQKNNFNILEREIKILQRENENLQKEIEEMRSKINSLNDEVVALNKKDQEDDSFIESMKKKMEVLGIEKTRIESELNNIRKEFEENKFFAYHFSRSGLKTYMANKSIRIMQDICNFYLQKFKTSLQISISGYKVLNSGEVRDKIDITVLKNGMDKGVFKRYSGGQRSRLDLCGILTIHTLINNTVEHGKGLDLLMIDEIGDLDATGKIEIIKILNTSGITNVLVMHEIKDVQHKNKVFVGYKNEESFLIEK